MTMQPTDYPPHGFGPLASIVALYGRGAITRVYRVPFRSAVPAAGSVGNPTQPQTFRWRTTGIVLACYGTTLGATAAEAANLEFQVLMKGSQSLITDGSNVDFMSYRAAFGDAQNWFPLGVPVSDGEDWQVAFQNLSVAGITPSLYFAINQSKQS